VTGPNMAGKSVFVRQVALITLMAHMGSFVPAAEAHIGRVDRIFARVGASDDIAHGRSTFLVEMSETAYILRHATDRSLVILDEVGRGTSTYDGISIAWAVAEDLHNTISARTLFATHYYELTALADHLPAAHNVTLAVLEQGNDIIFLRQVVPGTAKKSFGTHVARLAGVPERVIARASQVLAHLEKEHTAPLLRPNEVREVHLISPSMPTNGQNRSPETLADEEIQQLREMADIIRHQDFANTTPLQALLLLHDLQEKLRTPRREKNERRHS